MSTTTPGRTTPPAPSRLGRDDESAAEDLRRMAPIYTAVVIVETVVLLAIWWFQRHFAA